MVRQMELQGQDLNELEAMIFRLDYNASSIYHRNRLSQITQIRDERGSTCLQNFFVSTR